jgi:hypothetical protein
MPTAFSPCLNDWKTLYQAAILETNKGLLPQRVSEAEEAVNARGREIFHGNGTPEEREAEALEDALYTLRALGIDKQWCVLQHTGAKLPMPMRLFGRRDPDFSAPTRGLAM